MTAGRTPPLDGLVVVDKAPGWTSHDVVARLRGILGQRRVGHAGTLDPDATGLLLIGAGRVTRLLRFLTALPKTYVGEVVLGTETTTLDAAGEITAVHPMDGVTLDDVRSAAVNFVGAIEQVPPMVSAVKVAGRRLHEIARAGDVVDRVARTVTVHRLGVEATGDPLVFRLDVECSSGTYVRALAADIGRSLGGGAHLGALRRTAIGSFNLAEAHPVEGVDTSAVLAPAHALRDYPSLVVDDAMAASVAHGKVLARRDFDTLGVDDGGPWAVLGRHGDLLAVYEAHTDGRVKPAVVLSG